MSEHESVAAAKMRRRGNRYKLECGYYIECGCIHEIGTLAYCLHHGKDERVIWAAIITPRR